MADAIFQAHAAFCCGLPQAKAPGVAYWRWKTWEGLVANRKPSGQIGSVVLPERPTA
jgi:hypothetical protein